MNDTGTRPFFCNPNIPLCLAIAGNYTQPAILVVFLRASVSRSEGDFEA